MQELQTLRSGQQVVVRDESWTVVGTEPFDRLTLVTLRGIGAENLGETSRVLSPFDCVHIVAPGTKPRARSRGAALKAAARAIADSPGWGDCWTAATAALDLRRWQLEPALAAVGGRSSRFLLADAVGLGKTIQALLILAELSARGLVERALILTPPALREQWAAEMTERFKLDATVFDHAAVTAAVSALPPGVNPWSTSPCVIASIDLVKRPEVRAAIDPVPIDLLIVDEAHHLTPGSDRGAVVGELASRIPWLVLVTATPHSGDEAAFQYLCGLGRHSPDDPLLVFRRTRDAWHRPRRRTHLLPIRPTADEGALIAATLEYTRALWLNGVSRPGCRLVASVIARRTAAAASAARLTLERRLALISGDRVADEEHQPLLPWQEVSEDADIHDGLLAEPGFEDRDREVASLAMLIALARRAEAESSKLRAIRRVLRRTREQVIVFSEYRDAAVAVASGLQDLTTLEVLHGGLAVERRREALARFIQGSVRTLIATDAAGEGLNLQAACRLVINLELPWNPLRLEQRVGRVDRIGQRRSVHALHLAHRGSFEDTVLSRLERRQSRAAADLDRATTAGEHEVERTIFENGELALSALPDLPQSAPMEERVGHPATARRLRLAAPAPRARSRSSRPLFAAGRRRPIGSVVLLFAADLRDGRGRLIQRELLPIEVSTRARSFRQLSSCAVTAVACDNRLQALLTDLLFERERAAGAVVSRTGAEIGRRAAAILEHLHGRRAVAIQRSLFDRRVEQHAEARQAAVSVWQCRLECQLDAARALTALSASAPHLIAAWPAD